MSRKRIACHSRGCTGGFAPAGVRGRRVRGPQPRGFSTRFASEIVSTVETATGGRVEVGAFRFDWTHLRAEVGAFTLHGNEPAGKACPVPRLLACRGPENRVPAQAGRGHPVPRNRGPASLPDRLSRRPDQCARAEDQANGRPPVESLLDLAIGRFELRNGIFEIETRGQTPFDARGQNLNLKLLYELAGPRYRGDSRHPAAGCSLPGVFAPAARRHSRRSRWRRIASPSPPASSPPAIRASSSRVRLDDLAAPRATLQLRRACRRTRCSPASCMCRNWNAARSKSPGNGGVGRVVRYLAPQANSTPTMSITATPPSALRNYRADGDVTAGPQGIDVNDMRLSGAALASRSRASATLWPCGLPLAAASPARPLRGQDLDLRGIDWRMSAAVSAARPNSATSRATPSPARSRISKPDAPSRRTAPSRCRGTHAHPAPCASKDRSARRANCASPPTSRITPAPAATPVTRPHHRDVRSSQRPAGPGPLPSRCPPRGSIFPASCLPPRPRIARAPGDARPQRHSAGTRPERRRRAREADERRRHFRRHGHRQSDNPQIAGHLNATRFVYDERNFDSSKPMSVPRRRASKPVTPWLARHAARASPGIRRA